MKDLLYPVRGCRFIGGHIWFGLARVIAKIEVSENGELRLLIFFLKNKIHHYCVERSDVARVPITYYLLPITLLQHLSFDIWILLLQ